MKYYTKKQDVSNPLGWEGDPEDGLSPAAVTTVSNPLGWEGDKEVAAGGDVAAISF